MPRRRAARTAGAMMRASSSPNRPCSPACGFRPAHGDARRRRCRSGRAGLCAVMLDRLEHAVAASDGAARRRARRCVVTRTTRRRGPAIIMRTGTPPQSSRQQLGVPGEVVAGRDDMGLADRRRHQPPARARSARGARLRGSPRRPLHRTPRGAARRCAAPRAADSAPPASTWSRRATRRWLRPWSPSLGEARCAVPRRSCRVVPHRQVADENRLDWRAPTARVADGLQAPPPARCRPGRPC